jgi:Lipase maturation factor
MAALYAIAFLSAFNQFPALLGERGLEPVPQFLDRLRFRDVPTLFHWRYSDRLLRVVTLIGTALSLITLAGLTERAPWWAHILVWLAMYALYLSIVNVGQTFYSFGWESMILEAGFFAAFLGPRDLAPPVIVIVILRWMLFRTEFGAGMIKIRGDECWRDLTCLNYHYETQPVPNALSWYFHRLPKWFQRQSVMVSHFVQLVAPWGLFAPQPFASIAAGFLVAQQLLLIISGNYAWLNWLTVVLGVTGFSIPMAHVVAPRPIAFDVVVYALALFTLILSIKPAMNLFSPRQMMNYCWNRYHLVCAYGAFGSVTKERYEIVIEGSDDGMDWKAYEFKAKPVDPARRPPQVAPYHLRLDWLVWFLPFTVRVVGNRLMMSGYEMWFIRFVQKLLHGDRAILALLRKNPFPDHPPKFIHATYYLYRFTDWNERRETGAWWKRTLIAEYLPPVGIESLQRALE